MKKVFHSEISEKASESNGDVTIAGWANKSVVDDVGDLMKFEAVDMSRFAKNPIVFFNHNRNIPVGKVVESKITEAGLWVKAVISKSKDPIVSMVRDLVEEGILKTFSIGFEVKEEKFNRADNYNEITKWKLNEISIVTLPANTDAEFALTKSLEGMSAEQARTAVMKALGMTQERKKEEPPSSDTPPSGEEPCPKCGKYPCECNEEDDEKNKKSAFQDCVSAKIPKLIDEGKPEEQAVAIAMSMCREEGKCDVSIMSQEMFDFASTVAKGCKKPKKNDEQEGAEGSKAAPGEVATPVSHPSDDPTNFGSPQMDMMKAILALMGKISEQLGAIQSLLEKDEGMGENGNVNPAPPPDNGEASAKGLAKIAEIRSRIDALVKDL